MTHLLEIRDDEDTLLYNLLFASVGNAVITSLSSRQIIPLSDGRWEERFRIFSGSANMAPDVSCSILDLDKTVKSISDYGDNPAYNAPIWLYEKNEGEAVLTRRAPLFSASQQPVQEGAIGQLLINSGYTGLLTIERGDWEDIELTTVSFPDTPTLYFDTIDIEAAGSVDGRVDNLQVVSDSVGTNLIAVGVRDLNYGVDNFQPCINLGIATKTGGTNNLFTYGTSPTAQAAPVSNIVSITNPTLTAYTFTIPLSDVSQSTLDTVNRDYVGKYLIFLRYGIGNTPSKNQDLYVKFSNFNGYDGEYVYNDPVYISVTDDTVTGGNYCEGVLLGAVSIPIDIYHDTGGSDTSLADFTFGLDVGLIGTKDDNMSIIVDSLILVPMNSVILSARDGDVFPTILDLNIRNTPNGTVYLDYLEGRVASEIRSDMSIPNEGGVIVYYNEHHDSNPQNLRIIRTNYHPRYNSTSG